MTINDLVRGRSTLDQLSILQNADYVFEDRKGRYFIGDISLLETELLDPVKVRLVRERVNHATE